MNDTIRTLYAFDFAYYQSLFAGTSYDDARSFAPGTPFQLATTNGSKAIALN